jgi:acid phosphatase
MRRGWAGAGVVVALVAGSAAFALAQSPGGTSDYSAGAVNIGDQESDLDGGHADRDFKLPNPFYFISD